MGCGRHYKGAMQILFIGFNMPYYGNFRRSSEFARQLARAGHSVTLLTTSAAQRRHIVERDFFGIRLVETPALFSGPVRSGWDPWGILARLAWLRGRRFDLVHAFECRPTVIYPALYAARKAAPLFVDWADWFGQGGSVEERPNPVLRNLLRPVETFYENHFRPQARGNTTICSTLTAKALQLGIPAEQIAQIPDGCNPQTIYPADRLAARQRLGLPADGPYVGYLGAAFRNDLAFMVDAWQALQAIEPRARFLWFGAKSSRDREAFRPFQNAHIFGRFPQEQINDFLAAIDAGWLPMRNSPANRGRWPSKINEYLSAGRPVVSTSLSDLGELFEKWNIGVLAPEDPAEFARSTAALLQEPDLQNQMGAVARHLAENELSWQSLSRTLLEPFYYKRLSV